MCPCACASGEAALICLPLGMEARAKTAQTELKLDPRMRSCACGSSNTKRFFFLSRAVAAEPTPIRADGSSRCACGRRKTAHRVRCSPTLDNDVYKPSGTSRRASAQRGRTSPGSRNAKRPAHALGLSNAQRRSRNQWPLYKRRRTQCPAGLRATRTAELLAIRVWSRFSYCLHCLSRRPSSVAHMEFERENLEVALHPRCQRATLHIVRLASRARQSCGPAPRPCKP